MRKHGLRNIAASNRARLLGLARQRREDFQFLLGRWMVERFLYRLGISPLRDRFILKGAMLFTVWSGDLYRPTRDIDLLGCGSPAVNDVIDAIRQICETEAEDGLRFDLNAIEGSRIKEDAEYEGVRLKVPASLDGAKVQLQIDVGFGDAVEPAADNISFPVILPMEHPTIRAYPPEVVIAEKCQAMVLLGIANSRMKDFYDVWMMARTMTFQMDRLATALVRTFERRKTDLPADAPFALTPDFLNDAAKQTQWRAFASRSGLTETLPTLTEVGEAIKTFLVPALQAARSPVATKTTWNPPGPWRAISE